MSDSNRVPLDDSIASNSLDSWISTTMVKTGRPVYTFFCIGFMKAEKLLDTLEAMGGKPMVIPCERVGAEAAHLFEDGGMVVSYLAGEDKKRVTGAFFDEELCHKVRNVLNGMLSNQTVVGTFHVLVKNMQGYSLANAGQSFAPLVRDNYAPDVLAGMDHVAECMGSRDPCGRLVLLDGPPGTGKSYAIRGLAASVDATFVVVAPSLIGSLSGPDLVPVLLQEKKAGRPVVLIMEDADHALVTRERGSLSQLSELLNIGDGLLGDLIDLRILATTNAARDDLDKAVTRPGRLCRRISMEELCPGHHTSIYERLTGEKRPGELVSRTTLADVYRRARDSGWKPSKKPGVGQYL